MFFYVKYLEIDLALEVVIVVFQTRTCKFVFSLAWGKDLEKKVKFELTIQLKMQVWPFELFKIVSVVFEINFSVL